jgi:SynChlorMet cassette protein ScmD
VDDVTKPIANGALVFREEFDDWAVLFDADSGEAYGLDPVGAFLWKRFDGNHSVEDLLAELKTACEDGLPEQAPQEIRDFIAKLARKGYVGSA